MAYVRSFGCQQNANEGERIKGVLTDVGYGVCNSPEEADLILFNTCAVREHAEQRVFGNIGALKKLKEQNKGLIIGLCGCMAQQPHIVEKLRQSYSFVDIVFGVNGIDTLPELIARKLQSRRRVLDTPVERLDIVEEMPIRRDSSFRAWLPIMYGCDNFCTYCIVPYVRGRERSRTPEAILAEFRQLVQEGYKEITLLGQNVNSYGKGLPVPMDFADLLQMLCQVPGDYHIRFMTSHPKDASHKLIDVMAANPDHICNHLHLPVQCGSDRVLKEMNRHYTVEHYLELIDYARAKMPDITFSSDIIVGFPGETEEDFEMTLDLIRKVKYMQLFTFIYSKRTGTKAAVMPDPYTHKDKTERMARLLAAQDEIASEQVAALVGQTRTVLVEGFGRGDGLLNGRLRNNLVVEFAGDAALIGTEVQVELTGSRMAMLSGHMV
ncbi:MAG: tRNA (N6-isopentenyl adenosine(37)-C2)-methylthiotransferase MiaB [Oscillospiraceae bacterium]|nr:tRNA (N6-isopentenyl adenosine(37)-C2)-methylthiotransferase MiaB [Oscillospiraceae bacterium]